MQLQDVPPQYEYRLNSATFYLRFVKPDGVLRQGGIIMPIDHYDMFVQSPSARGLKVGAQAREVVAQGPTGLAADVAVALGEREGQDGQSSSSEGSARRRGGAPRARAGARARVRAGRATGPACRDEADTAFSGEVGLSIMG